MIDGPTSRLKADLETALLRERTATEHFRVTAMAVFFGGQFVLLLGVTLFDSLIEGINAHRGIVNKFLGDGFMAVFGAPVSDGRDCRNGVEAALDLVQRVELLVAEGRIPATRIGVGLHAGEAVTGNIGSQRRREYTVIGDVVNTASRIESLNKRFGSQVLISRAVFEAIDPRPASAVAMEPVAVKGRSEAVEVWRLA